MPANLEAGESQLFSTPRTDLECRTVTDRDCRPNPRLDWNADPWLSLKEAGAYVNANPETLRRAIAAGRLAAARCGRLHRVRRSALDAWLEDGRVQ